jgi:hypothetical protein
MRSLRLCRKGDIDVYQLISADVLSGSHWSLAVGPFEAADPGLPACGTGKLAGECVVLIHVPERAVLGGIDIHHV